MGITTAPSKILVTGANGYVAMWAINQLLNAGYSVRGAVRTLEKSKDLRERFLDFVEAGKLEFSVVQDMTIDGAFDDVVKDVDGIIHTASPVSITADNPEEVIKPAVSGTLGILESALTFGNKLKRIILTSSTATVFTPVTQPTVLNKTHWNTVAVEEVERLDRGANSFYKYMTSKRSEDSMMRIKMTSHRMLVSSFLPLCWVGVGGLTLAHMLALQKPDAGGERLIISAGPFAYQDFIDIASTHRSPLKAHEYSHHKEFGGNLPKGCSDIKRNGLLIYDNAKGLKILGPELKYRSMEETTADILKDYAAKGW